MIHQSFTGKMQRTFKNTNFTEKNKSFFLFIKILRFLPRFVFKEYFADLATNAIRGDRRNISANIFLEQKFKCNIYIIDMHQYQMFMKLDLFCCVLQSSVFLYWRYFD